MRIVIAGAGEVGTHLAKLLSREDMEISLLDESQERLGDLSANYDMLTNYMDSTLLDDEAVIWAAQYGGACDVKGNYLYWQCAEDAAVGGIEGNVDHDIWYIEPGKVYSTSAKGKKDAASVGDCTVDFDESSYKLKNHRAKPEVTVTYEGKKLRRGKDYVLSFVKNTESGTGYAIVRGKKKYKDWIAVPFTIE